MGGQPGGREPLLPTWHGPHCRPTVHHDAWGHPAMLSPSVVSDSVCQHQHLHACILPHTHACMHKLGDTADGSSAIAPAFVLLLRGTWCPVLTLVPHREN